MFDFLTVELTFVFLGYDAVSIGQYSLIFWTVLLPPSLGSNSAKKVLLMLLQCFSKLLVNIHQSTMCYKHEEINRRMSDSEGTVSCI